MPPETASVSPVTQRDSSDAKNTATGAISSGCPVRSSGVRATACEIVADDAHRMCSRRDTFALSLAAIFGGLTPALGANSTVRLLFVHGRGQAGLKPTDLQAAWLKALAEGAQALGKVVPADVEAAFPYYGDALEDFVRQANLPLTADVVARGGVQAILRAIDKHGGGLSSDDRAVYPRCLPLYHGANRSRCARCQTDKPTIVVAHSLGSVVPYNVLRADTQALSVSLFTTVGSPLGIRAIRDQLVPLAFPAHVRAWYNAYDTRDVVALFPLDNDNFPVSPR